MHPRLGRKRVRGSDEETDVVVVIRGCSRAYRLDQRQAERREQKGKRFQYSHSHKETRSPRSGVSPT